MKSRSNNQTLTRLLTILCLAVLAGPALTMPQEESLTAAEMRGRAIYRKGGEGIKAFLGAIETPASTLPCANCHGATGAGGKEGGWRPPPLTWGVLTAPHRSDATGAARPAYDDGMLKRAIVAGINPSGEMLHPGMPRYAMSDGQLSDLIAYLKAIGAARDNDPGVAAARIKIGSALPLSGPLASLGLALQRTIETVLSEQNDRGGVFGRRIELVVEDSQGSAAGTAEATRRLLETHQVFALIGSYLPAGAFATAEMIARAEVPLIGPIAPTPAATTNPLIYYLLPDLGSQGRALVDYAVAEKFGGSIALLFADTELNRDAASGVKMQSKMRGVRISTEMSWPVGKCSPMAVIDRLQQTGPQSIFMFAPPEDVKAMAAAMSRAGLEFPTLSATAMLGREAFDLPAAFSRRLFLAHPADVAEPEATTAFERLRLQAEPSGRHIAFQAVVYVAARLFLEAALSSGRSLNRSGFGAALDRIKSFQAEPWPPISFAPHRRIGAIGAYVVQADVQTQQFRPRTAWMEPQENP